MAKNSDTKAMLKKNWVWFASGGILVFGLVIWFVEKGRLEEENLGRITKNKKSKETAGRLGKGKDGKPPVNKVSIEKMAAGWNDRAKKVDEVWKRVYEEQKKVLIWPVKSATQDGFTQAEVDAFKKLVPPEQLINTGSASQAFRAISNSEKERHRILDASNRRTYSRYAAIKQLPVLAKLYGAKWVKDGSDDSSGDGDAEEKEAQRAAANVLVIWDSKSQKMLKDLLAMGTNPTEARILYAQEDIWVYKALAEIIKKTNQDANATGNYNAAVKRITILATGENAIEARGKYKNEIYVAKSDGSSRRSNRSGRSEEERRASADKRQGVNAGSSSSTDEGSASQSAASLPDDLAKLADKRYVDSKGDPLSGAKIVALMRGGKTEFKRMPVFLRLTIDQRYLGQLQANFANSPLTVETRDITLRFGVSSDVGRDKDRDSQSKLHRDRNTFYDAEVVIFGVIYIYYPDPSQNPKGGAGTSQTDAGG